MFQGDKVKHIFTYKNRHYGYDLEDGSVRVYEITEAHCVSFDEIDAETTYKKLTNEDWEYIINELSDNEQGV